MNTMKRVVLKKVCADDSGIPIGKRYEYTYVSMARFQAEHRAWLALRRDHPTAARESWRLVPEEDDKVAVPTLEAAA